jgi:hypothetical protein
LRKKLCRCGQRLHGIEGIIEPNLGGRFGHELRDALGAAGPADLRANATRG